MLATANTETIFPLLPNLERLAEANLGAERHLVVANGSARHRLCIRNTESHAPACMIIPHDAHLAARLAAAVRYDKAVHGRRLGPDRTASPPAYRRARLVLLLTILDGLEAGATARDLAFGLVFARHPSLAGATWKGSDERRHTLRLIAEARRMMNSGYRTLLLRG